jgi:cytochrome c oxidase subunit 2
MRRRAIIQMLVIGVLAGVVTGAVAVIVPWLPDAASEQANEIDDVYWFVTIICVCIFALVAGVSIYAGWKFRARDDDMDDGAPIHGHTGIEIAWTALPVALVVAMSIFSIIVLDRITTLPADHRTIEVKAQQFAWSFTYSDLDRTEGDLVLELRKPYELQLTATDVIHSFWVPEFRMKQDAVPGITTETYITPTKVGTYAVICTELCGLGHSTMRARAIVLSHADYEKWAAAKPEGGTDTGGTGTGGTDTGAEADGMALFTDNGCAGCHTLAAAEASGTTGPDLDKVLAGKDAEFIRTSIIDPNTEIAAGFEPNVMPSTYGDQLSDEQLNALVDFLLESVGS